jgi:copper chaperone
MFGSTETPTITVKGMSCGHCVQAVTKATTALDGVKKADVSLEDGTAAVTYNPKKVTLAAIKAAITEEGFEPA